MEHLITDWVGADLIDSITHTIIQSVWQGTIIGFIIWMIYRTKASSNPNTKYKIALLGIISLFIISMITFGMCYSTGGSIKTAQVTDTISSWTSNLVTLDAESGTITNAWIGYLWFLGVIGFSIKFLLDLFLVIIELIITTMKQIITYVFFMLSTVIMAQSGMVNTTTITVDKKIDGKIVQEVIVIEGDGADEKLKELEKDKSVVNINVEKRVEMRSDDPDSEEVKKMRKEIELEL